MLSSCPQLLINSSQTEESTIILNNTNAEKPLQSCLMRELRNKSYPYLLIENSDNSHSSQIHIPENFDKEIAECEFLPPSEVCSDLKQFYFIIPHEDLNFTDKIKNITTPSLKLFDTNAPQISEIILNDSSLNDVSKEPDSLYLEIFDSKEGPSDKIINNSSERDTNTSTFEEKLIKRNLLLPKKLKGERDGAEINCDKCNMVLHSMTSNSEMFIKSENDQLWICVQCKVNFQRLDHFQMHKLEEHGEIKLFLCPHCIYATIYFSSFEHHIRSKHHFERRFTCKLCDKKFLRLYDLKLHLNIHLELKTYVCHLCGRQFTHNSNLRRHMVIHTKVNLFQCKFCNSRFSQFSSLFTHLVSHTNGGSCPDCGAKYRSISGLKNHAKSIHRKLIGIDDIKKIFFKDSDINSFKTFHCKVCSENFLFKKGLEMHESTFHSGKCFPCKNCLKILITINDFKSHPCVKHKKFKGNKEIKDRPLSFSCTKCQEICDSYKSAENHICKSTEKQRDTVMDVKTITVTVMEENLPDETLLININKEESNSNYIYSNDFETKNLDSASLSATKTRVDEVTSVQKKKSLRTDFRELGLGISQELKDDIRQGIQILSENKGKTHKENVTKKSKFTCKFCSKEFTKKWNWSQHMGTHDTTFRQYQCENCMQIFSYRSTYLRHIKTHSESSSKEVFPCLSCSKTFKSKAILQQHIKRIHQKVKNFACNICSKEFYDKFDYNYHLRLHKGELLFVCGFCGKKFSHSSNLYRHERMHTGERPHKCPYCPKAFIQAVTLREHLRKHESVVSKDETENITCAPSVVNNTDLRNPEKEFGIINLDEMNVLSSYIASVSSDFAIYET